MIDKKADNCRFIPIIKARVLIFMLPQAELGGISNLTEVQFTRSSGVRDTTYKNNSLRLSG